MNESTSNSNPTPDSNPAVPVALVVSVPNPASASNPLEDASIAALVTELLGRGKELQTRADFLTELNKGIAERVGQFNSTSKEALAACEQAAKTGKVTCEQIAKTSKQELADMLGMSKHELRNAAAASRQECETLTSGLVQRVEKLEAECLKRVESAEAKCQSAVDAVTAEFAQRADAAEEESLRCIEQSERAVRTADALGASFNVLNERIHGIEMMFRTLLGGGTSAPVYTPTLAQPQSPPLQFPVPAPVAPAAPALPVSVPAPAPAPAESPKGNGLPRRRYNTPPMQFVLVGPHHKDQALISAKLPAHIARAVTITVIENTSKELLPKSADYCLVSGDHDMALRWKFCLEHYGSAKCVRLENSSIANFRAKIEQIYTARHPLRAPEHLVAVGNVLEQVDGSRF